MNAEITDLIQQAWRVALIMLIPLFLVPVVGGASSLLLGLLGVRDEGLAYAVRVLAMVAVVALSLPACTDDVVALMRMALQ